MRQTTLRIGESEKSQLGKASGNAGGPTRSGFLWRMRSSSSSISIKGSAANRAELCIRLAIKTYEIRQKTENKADEFEFLSSRDLPISQSPVYSLRREMHRSLTLLPKRTRDRRGGSELC